MCIHRHWYNSTGETAFEQDEYEEAIDRLEQLQVILRVMWVSHWFLHLYIIMLIDTSGIDFQPISQAVDKSKSRNKVSFRLPLSICCLISGLSGSQRNSGVSSPLRCRGVWSNHPIRDSTLPWKFLTTPWKQLVAHRLPLSIAPLVA